MYKMGLSENQLKTPRVLSTPELIAFFQSQAEQYQDIEETLRGNTGYIELREAEGWK